METVTTWCPLVCSADGDKHCAWPSPWVFVVWGELFCFEVLRMEPKLHACFMSADTDSLQSADLSLTDSQGPSVLFTSAGAGLTLGSHEPI